MVDNNFYSKNSPNLWYALFTTCQPNYFQKVCFFLPERKYLDIKKVNYGITHFIENWYYQNVQVGVVQLTRQGLHYTQLRYSQSATTEGRAMWRDLLIIPLTYTPGNRWGYNKELFHRILKCYITNTIHFKKCFISKKVFIKHVRPQLD